MTNTAFRTRTWNATGYAYARVASPSGRPVDQGWFEKDEHGRYVPTADTSVASGKTYYARSEAEEGWATSEENTAGFYRGHSTIKYYGNNTTLHGPGTGDGTVLAWEFGTTTEANLSELFGVANIFDYIGHHSDGATNLVQLHAWDCDNDRAGDQADAEITFGTLLLTDDDATPPTSPGYDLLGSGTNYVNFGTLASWNWTSTDRPATWSTNEAMKGIDAGAMSAWSVGLSDTAITGDNVSWTEHGTAPVGQDWSGFNKRYMSLSGGMGGSAYRPANPATGQSKYFQFDVSGRNGARWTADTLQFDNRVTATGPVKYTLTVQEADNVTSLNAVTDGQKTPDWNITGGTYEKVRGIPRFTMENAAGTAALTSPQFQPNGKVMARVHFRVGRIGAVKDDARLTVSYKIGTSGTPVALRTYTSSEFTGSAADSYANYSVETFDLPVNQTGNFTVTWAAENVNGSQGFLLTDVHVVLQNSFKTEKPLVEDFVVEKFVDGTTESNQETVKNVVLTWDGDENSDGSTWRYRLYAYGGTGGNWGINRIKLHGITITPRGMDVTDGDLRNASWVNSLEVVDGEMTGWDTAKSGLWLTGDKKPTYTMSYPEADEEGGRAGTVFASGDFTFKDGKIREAAYSNLADGRFEADPTGWTLVDAEIAEGSGAHPHLCG